MGLDWNDIAATADDAYPDWERQIRPEFLKDKIKVKIMGIPYTFTAPHWRPSYARLKGETGDEIRENARKLLALTKEGENAAFEIGTPKLTDRHLTSLINSADEIPEDDRYIFVYTSEAQDGSASSNFEDHIEIVHNGVSFPNFNLAKTLEPLKGSSTSVPDGGVPVVEECAAETGDDCTPDEADTTATAPPVVTAVIDTEIAVWNERFCVIDQKTGLRKTRVHHYWRQTQEVPSELNTVDVGRIFTKDNIDCLLAETNGDEALIETALRGQSTGQPGFRSPVPALDTRLNSVSVIDANGNPVDPGLRNKIFSELFSEKGGDPQDDSGPRQVPYPKVFESRPKGMTASHGTWAMDLAAGYPIDDAPEDRPIVAVSLPDFAVADTSGTRLFSYVLMGVQQILEWVDDWCGQGVPAPVVINISLANTAGPRDGTGFLEREVQRLVDARNETTPTKVVFAAGNAYRSRLRGQKTLSKNETDWLEWRVPPGDKSPSFLELRVDDGVPFDLTFETPEGLELRIDPTSGQHHELKRDGVVIARVYSCVEPGGKRRIAFALAPTLALERPSQFATAGSYALYFGKETSGTVMLEFDIQRDESLDNWPPYGQQSLVDHPEAYVLDNRTFDYEEPGIGSVMRREKTLSAFATSDSDAIFMVGAAIGKDPDDGADHKSALYTGAGWDGRTPDCASVAETRPGLAGLLAAGNGSAATAIYSGSSGAAPRVTRALVDWLAQKPASHGKADALREALQLDPNATRDLQLGIGVAGLSDVARPARTTTG